MIIAGMIKPTIAELLKKTCKKRVNTSRAVNDFDLKLINIFKANYLLPNKELSQILGISSRQVKDLKYFYINYNKQLTPYIYTDMLNKTKNKNYKVEQDLYLTLPILQSTMLKIVYSYVKNGNDRKKAQRELENLTEYIMSRAVEVPSYSSVGLSINTIDPSEACQKNLKNN